MSSSEIPTTNSENVIALLNEIAKTTAATRSELAEYRNETDKKIIGISSKVDGVCDNVKILEDRLAALERNSNVNPPNVASESSSVELIKQFNLKNNVCISGIPSKQNESTIEIVTAVGKALKVQFGPHDIQSTYRTKASKKSPGLIIIKFANFEKKIELLSSKRNKKSLKVKELHLNLDKPKGELYINNQLTPHFAEIFMKAKRATFNEIIKSCWIGSNCVTIKLNDDKQILIKSMAELDAVIGKGELGAARANKSTSSVIDDNTINVNIINSTPIPASSNSEPKKRGRKRKNSIDRQNAAKIVKNHSDFIHNQSSHSITSDAFVTSETTDS